MSRGLKITLALVVFTVLAGLAVWYFLIRDKDEKGSEVSKSAAVESQPGVPLRLTSRRPQHQQQQKPRPNPRTCAGGESFFMDVLCLDSQSALALSQADSTEKQMKLLRKLLTDQYGEKEALEHLEKIRARLQMDEDREEMETRRNERAVVVGKHCGDSEGVDQLLDDGTWDLQPDMPGYACGIEAIQSRGRFDPLAPMKRRPEGAVEADELDEDMRRNLHRSQDVLEQIAAGRKKAVLNRKLLHALRNVKGREAEEARRILESKVFAPTDVSEGLSMEELVRRSSELTWMQLQPRQHKTGESGVHAYESLNRDAAGQDVQHQASRKRALTEAALSESASLEHHALVEVQKRTKGGKYLSRS